MADGAMYDRVKPLMPALMKDFYDRLFSDVMIDFFFIGRDKEDLIDKQIAFMSHALGGPEPYGGKSLRAAHEPLKILEGQFQRRHQVLKEVLSEHEVDEDIQQRWLEIDRGFKDKVIKSLPCHDA